MGVLNLVVSTARDAATLTKTFETATGKEAVISRLINFLVGIQTGSESGSGGVSPSVAISVTGNAVQASGTLTFVSAVATNTFAINGVTFTAVASGATGNQFNIGGSDTLTAANVVTALNASATALISGYITASSALGVVTIKSTHAGIYGNQVTLAGGTNITASVARLAGGAADPTAQLLNF